ncbi:MAG: HAMP domain-containing sensor histidine kinase, partial [bacterium]
TTILFVLLLLVPTLIVGLLLGRLLSHERARLARAGALAAEEQTRAVANQIQVALDGFQAGIMQQLAALPAASLAAQLPAWEKRDPLIQNAFILSADNRVLLPDAATGLTGEERAFLLRYEPLFSGRTPWTTPTPDSAASSLATRPLISQNLKSSRQYWRLTDHETKSTRQGWISWFEGRGLHLLAWAQQPDGVRYGVEIEMSGLLARMITAFPKQMPAGQTLALLDGQGVVMHGVGALEYQPSLPRLATVSLAPALPHWQLAAAGTGAAGSARGLMFLLSAILCVILLLAILGGGWLLLRDAHRSAIDARTRTTFVANVSHELKTPLTTIRMYAELLSEGRARDESRRAHYLEVIVQESQRLTRLINNVLDFSRLEQGRKTYRPEALDLAAETHRIVEAQLGRLQAAGLAVELAGADTPCPAHADRDAVEQALLNLLDNAAKYGVSGKRLLVRVATADGAAQVHVCDWGPGVPAAHRSRLFQQFHRADDSLTTRQPGCGLGLSISRRLLRDQGGELRYETAEGGGACFVMTVPAEEGKVIGQ